MRKTCFSWLSAGVVAGAMLFGCASRTASFNVTRPAVLNAAAVGNTFSIAGMNTGGGRYIQAAAEVVADLQNRIAHSLNPSIRLLPQGGGIVITGDVLADDYAESMERSQRTCTRQVEAGRNAQGIMQYRTESYTCTDLRRVGTATSRINFSLTNGQTSAVVLSQVFESTNQVVTTGIESPYENQVPDAIDPNALIHRTRGESVETFAHIILPYQETVTVEFEDCDGAPQCQQGLESARAGTPQGLAAAEALFTQVIANYQPLSAQVPPNEVEKIGEAFYNRALVREYLGRYAQAAADLNRAIALRPGESDWPHELQSIQQMSQAQESLRSQGAVSNEQQNVQQAGTP
ncbi:MAG: tetratricopeptide repeat protein [Deltaproteobacteria bacterium]|nr:tetratricopeptide repeat protein [Deltaproteobacteria bacterium]